MAKRFLDTGFLSQKWIRKLTPEHKCFLIYIMLECDNGGIIDIDFEDIEFWIGKKIDKSLSFLPKGYVIFMKDLDKYFIPKFIEYQYSDLSSNKNIVAQARRILNKYGLLDENNEVIIDDFMLKLPKSQVTSNSNDIDKGNSKDKEVKVKYAEFVNLYESEYEKLRKQHGEFYTKKIIEVLDNYKGSNGKKYKSDYRAILSWVEQKVKDSSEYNNYMTKKRQEEAKSRQKLADSISSNLQKKIPKVDLINKLEDEEEE